MSKNLRQEENINLYESIAQIAKSQGDPSLNKRNQQRAIDCIGILCQTWNKQTEMDQKCQFGQRQLPTSQHASTAQVVAILAAAASPMESDCSKAGIALLKGSSPQLDSHQFSEQLSQPRILLIWKHKLGRPELGKGE